MHSLGGILTANEQAVRDEYAAAYIDGNYALCKRIREANPDLWPREEADVAT